MNISEKMIEDLIHNAIEGGKQFELVKRGFCSISQYDLFLRQVDLGSYGRLDLVGMSYLKNDQYKGLGYRRINVGVIEIKKGEVNINTFLQAIRYCKGIERVLKNFKLKGNFTISLVGTSVCHSDFIYLPDFLPQLSIYTVSLDLENGITFNVHKEYSLTNPKQMTLQKEVLYKVKNYLQDITRIQYREELEMEEYLKSK